MFILIFEHQRFNNGEHLNKDEICVANFIPPVLYNLTSNWVLRTPNAGRNSHFQGSVKSAICTLLKERYRRYVKVPYFNLITNIKQVFLLYQLGSLVKL